jgi:hypothetical protein
MPWNARRSLPAAPASHRQPAGFESLSQPRLTENSGGCLVYDRPLAESGLTWRQLTAWWAGDADLTGEEERSRALGLYDRLAASLDNGADQDTHIADPALYAQMAAADRRLRIAGYEVYRFGG